MPVSYEEVLELKRSLEPDYQERHEAHSRLRQYWHGKYWERVEREATSITSIFRDLVTPRSDVGPDLKLVHNVLQEVCVKYQTYLSVLPMIRVYVDPPSTTTRRAQATTKERYLYGMWQAARMSLRMSDQGWFLPLMGDCFLGAFPDIDKTRVRAVIRSPEYAFPIQNYDGTDSDGVIFCWETKQSAAKREFPNYTPQAKKRLPAFRRNKAGSDPKVEVLEYTDGKEFARWVDGQKVSGVQHDFGFNMFDHVKFINVPGEVWGHGAVEQSVNLNEMGNLYLSLMMHSAIDNVFPVMVLEDPSKAPEEIEKGAGAVIPVNAGGKVYYLTPPNGALATQAGFAAEVERMIKQATSMPDVNFGQFKASIITGKAINELQGAGTGSLVEMVQGVSLGSALASWNEKAIFYAQTMFRDETISLFGTEQGTVADLNPRQFALNIKGSKLIGSANNEVVFMPHLGMHEKIVMGLQMAGGGLVSRQWQREQVGIPDSQAMEEEILSEAVQDMVLGAIAAQMQQEPTPENAQQAEQAGHAYLAGGGGGGGGTPSPHPLLNAGAGAPPGVLPIGFSTSPGGGPGGAPPEPGAPPPPAPVPGPPNEDGRFITLQDAQMAFQGLQGIQGQVFLIGEVVARGQTDDDLEVAVTVPDDRQQIANQLRQYAGRLSFHIIEGEPSEAFIEVTPGAAPRAGESEDPELAALLGG